MSGVQQSFLPPSVVGKMFFLFTCPCVILLHFVGKLEMLRRLVQPYVRYPMHKLPTCEWYKLLFIAKCVAMDYAKKVGEYCALVHRFAAHATFLTVYIREAHAMDGEWPDDGSYSAKMHKKLQDRIEMAKTLQEMDFAGNLAVDSMADLACTVYGALPERLCLLSPDGRFFYVGRMGPWAYSLAELEANLDSICRTRR